MQINLFKPDYALNKKNSTIKSQNQPTFTGATNVMRLGDRILRIDPGHVANTIRDMAKMEAAIREFQRLKKALNTCISKLKRNSDDIRTWVRASKVIKTMLTKYRDQLSDDFMETLRLIGFIK